MRINIRKIRMNGFSQEVNKAFETGENTIFLGRACITEKRLSDNHDGTHNITYIAKPELVDFKASETNESVVDTHKVKTKSESQALRQKAFIVAQQLGLSEQGLYTEAISKGHEYLDGLMDGR